MIGPNGSGKTTLGKVLAGILKPTEGRAFLAGKDTRTLSLGAIGQAVGYLFQEPERQIFAPSVYEELAFVLRLQGKPPDVIDHAVNTMLGRFDLSALRDRFPFSLSRGEKQRLALAAVLVNSPDYLILDEPTTGLDLKNKRRLGGYLEELLDAGVGMMIISHDRAFATGYATRVIELSGGVVIRDSDRTLHRA